MSNPLHGPELSGSPKPEPINYDQLPNGGGTGGPKSELGFGKASIKNGRLKIHIELEMDLNSVQEEPQEGKETDESKLGFSKPNPMVDGNPGDQPQF